MFKYSFASAALAQVVHNENVPVVAVPLTDTMLKLISLSKLADDSYFNVSHDFEAFVESMGPSHFMPRDVEHSWQMRRNARM